MTHCIELCCPSDSIHVSIDLDEKSYVTTVDNPQPSDRVWGETKEKYFTDKLEEIRTAVVNGEKAGVYGPYHCKKCFNELAKAIGKSARVIKE